MNSHRVTTAWSVKIFALCFGVLTFATHCNHSHATDELSCRLELLGDLGWQTTNRAGAPDILNTRTCQHDLPPYLNLANQASAQQLLSLANSALRSDTTRCLINRQLKRSVFEATRKIIGNTDFIFPEPGEDPRDPFKPPMSHWVPSSRRGYDIPSKSLSDGIVSLYKKPVVAECAAAIQIAQLASLVEYFDESDRFVTPREIGIGIWREFAKSPSIANNSPLLINRKQRKHGLRRLADLGRGAFYNQSGYMSPVNSDPEFIDSLDNRGQNFLIVDITENAVTDLQNKRQPLRELNRVSVKIWKKFNRLRSTGLDKDTLEELMENDLLAADSFFKEVTVYIHPLRTGTFAKFLARQFRYNPRTAYRFEIYEDYQTGYFFKKYVNYRLSECERA